MNTPSIRYVLQFKLWSCVKIKDTSSSTAFYESCWEFHGQHTAFGHGYFMHRGRRYWAHRVAYEQAHGVQLPSALVVRHKCDNPPCVNPLHLLTGTQMDNQLDMEVRGRNPKGETHGMVTITAEQVRAIRWLFAEAKGVKGAIRAIAERLNLHKQLVAYVVRRETWAALPDEFESLIPKPEPLSAEELKYRWKDPNRGGSDLSPKDVQRVRALRDAGATLGFISKQLNHLAFGAISQICHRQTWSDVPACAMEDVLTPEEIQEAKLNGEKTACIGEHHHAARVTDQQVREIRWLAADYLARYGRPYGLQQALARRYSLSKAMANQIIKRRTWGHLADDFDGLNPKPAALEKIVVTRERR